MKTILLLLAGLFSASSACAEGALTLITEAYAPFSYQDRTGAYRGVAVDQIEIVMRDADILYTLDIMPWARAIALTETQPMYCVFAAARTPDREARFKWVTPLFLDQSVLVTRTGSGVVAKTIDDAKRFTVGTHRADYTEDLLKSLAFPNIDLSSDVDVTLRKLLEGRIDLMPMSIGVYKKLHENGSAVESVLPFSAQQLGIACQKDVPDEMIARMQAGLDRLIKDGVQDAILRRYGLDPVR